VQRPKHQADVSKGRAGCNQKRANFNINALGRVPANKHITQRRINMQEKDMVNDILSGVKSSLGTYAKTIVECNDPRLRQTFQQMRDADEKFQYDLYKIAHQKGYYTPAPPVDSSHTTQLKNQLSQSWS
jgi:spore coat protein CotF